MLEIVSLTENLRFRLPRGIYFLLLLVAPSCSRSNQIDVKDPSEKPKLHQKSAARGSIHQSPVDDGETLASKQRQHDSSGLENNVSSAVCPKWRSLGERFKLYQQTESASILEHQKFLYSIQLPEKVRPRDYWLDGTSDRGCDPAKNLCGPMAVSLLNAPVEIALCDDKNRAPVAIKSIHLKRATIRLNDGESKVQLERALKSCGAWPSIHYLGVPDERRIAHQVTFDQDDTGSCMAEYKHVEPQDVRIPSERVVVLSRFAKLSPWHFVQVTIAVVASERDADHLRGLMANIARSFQVDWENVRRYVDTSRPHEPHRDPLLGESNIRESHRQRTD